jgi:hypothetical protein
VLVTGVVAGIRHVSLPFDGRAVPGGLGLAASTSATATASVLWHTLLSRPSLVVETFVFAAVAALIPHARARGLWAIAALGGAMLAAALLPVPQVGSIPLIVSVWVTCLVLAWLGRPVVSDGRSRKARAPRSAIASDSAVALG